MTYRSARRSSRALAVAAIVLLLSTLASAQSLPTGPGHRGVVAVGAYQIFPENRQGNGVYGDNVLLLSLPGQVIQDVISLQAKNKFIYLARQGDQRTVAVRNGGSDPTPRISEVSPGYFFIVTVLDGVAYKKLVRVASGNLVDQLPASKTADGITVGQMGILFFHIGKMEPQPDGKSAYTLGIHFASFADNKVRHLGENILNAQPTLALKWLDDTRFEYKLADGTTRSLSISDLK